jgi:two-component sensor histidine kinase
MRQELRRSRKLLALTVAELRHRMVNDYAVIAAMLQRCADGVADPLAKRAFSETLAIIQTVAETQKLLGAAQRNQFNDSLLQALAGTLRAAYGVNSAKIQTNVAPDVHWPPEAAIPLCLIVTEAIANSFKHALPHAERPELTVEVAKDDDGKGRLLVRDNGPGCLGDLGEGEGLRLMRGLARQIGGEFQLRTSPGVGAEVLVTFLSRPGADTTNRLSARRYAAPKRR